MIAAAHVGTQALHIFANSRFDIAISKEREAIAVAPPGRSCQSVLVRSVVHGYCSPDVVVLHSRILDGLQKVDRRPRPQINAI
jgi:hypothetical protein